MDLVVRPMQERDVSWCLRLLQGHRAYRPRLLAMLPRIWRRLLRDEALTAIVVERRLRDGSLEPIAMGASVFVTPAWLEEARHADSPYLTERTLRQELSRRSPILRPGAIARDHAAGLNIVILHCVETPAGLSDDDRRILRFRIMDAFIEAHRGYRVHAVVQEFWDEIDPSYILHGWGRVLGRYEAYFAREHQPVPPVGRGPVLLGLTREEVATTPGDIIAPLFAYLVPRIHFSLAERRMLAQALQGLTDVELAARLDVSMPTIKTRWRAIYQRVGRTAPDLLPARDGADRPAVRGPEKRRRVLEYVRRHAEELRPSPPRVLRLS